MDEFDNRKFLPLIEVFPKLDILLYHFTTTQYKNQLKIVKPYFEKLYFYGRKVKVGRFINALKEVKFENEARQQRKEEIVQVLGEKARQREERLAIQGNSSLEGVPIVSAIALIDAIYNGNFQNIEAENEL